jgi:hypothetical protein
MKNNKELFNSTLYIEVLKYLISVDNKNYKIIYNQLEDICKYLCNYSNNNDYKLQIYKSIHSMLNNDKYYDDILIYCLFELKNNSDNRLKIIIISKLYTIVDKINTTEQTLMEELLQIINSSDDENTNADIADLLLKFTDESAKELGMKILSKLEGIKGRRNFYHSSQNVHHINVDENLNEFIKFLSSYQSLVIVKGTEEDLFEECKNTIYKIIKDDNKIKQSLHRIYLDPHIYNGFTMLTIFLKVWLIINKHDHKDELIKRLLEELTDMSETCSTGHILRLSNVFTGFGFTIKMSIQSEMRSKISYIIQKEIQCNKDVDLQLELIDNMTSEEEMNIFCKFFMKNTVVIKEELLKDYKDILDKDEFEELFRKELVFFETNHK